MIETLEGYNQAIKALRRNRSPRFEEIDKLERFVETTQYEGLCSWWDDSRPLWERAPCIAYPVVRNAITSNVDLIFGEGRFPHLVFELGEEREEEATDLSDELERLLRQCRFRHVARQVLGHAQGCRSSAVIFGVRNGKLVAETTKSKWCEPTLDSDGNVTRLEIRYPYLDRYKRADGHWAVRARLYRRVIDESKDTTYLPADAREDGSEPEWKADSKQTFTHGFGFCPVIWYAHLKGATTVNNIDGVAIHEHCTDEIRAHDIALSQRHRAALFCGDPQFIEIGVPPGYSPTEIVRKPEVPAAAGPTFNTEANPGVPVGAYLTGHESQELARKKGPGYVWQYANEKAKVELLSLPAGALDALDKHAQDLRIKLAESLCVVFLDPDNLKFAASTSGKALKTIKARQLDRCDQIRDDLTDCFLLRSVSLILRIAASKKLLKVKLPADMQDADVSDIVKVSWGEYFEPDAEDDKLIVDTVVAASQYLTDEMALEKLRPVFNIENVQETLEKLQKQREDQSQQEQDSTIAEAEALHKIANANPGGNRPGSGKKP